MQSIKVIRYGVFHRMEGVFMSSIKLGLQEKFCHFTLNTTTLPALFVS